MARVFLHSGAAPRGAGAESPDILGIPGAGCAERRPASMVPSQEGSTMRAYTPDSPQALARIVAMAIVTDARLDHRELQVLDDLGAYAMLGLTRDEFLETVHAYCRDLLAERRGEDRIRLLDAARIDRALAEVTDPRLRVMVCGLLLNVCDADGRFHETELAFLSHVLERWGYSLDSLKHQLETMAEARP
jgi:hypothetical protein